MIYHIHTDGGSRGNPGPAAIGVTIHVDETLVYEYAKSIGYATNNTAEYQAVIHALQITSSTILPKHPLPTRIQFLLDSQLVVEQLAGRYKVKHPEIATYVSTIQKHIQSFNIPITFSHIPRAQNSHADKLVNTALDVGPVERWV